MLDDIETQGGGGMTISAWIKPRSAGIGNSGVIVAKDLGAAGSWQLNTGDVGRINFAKNYSGANDLQVISGDHVYILNSWVHIVITWDGSSSANNVHIYSNGVEVGSYITRINGLNSKVSDANNDLMAGCAYGYCFDGGIDEIRIYNRTLSVQEIKSLYNLGNVKISQ